MNKSSDVFSGQVSKQLILKSWLTTTQWLWHALPGGTLKKKNSTLCPHTPHLCASHDYYTKQQLLLNTSTNRSV